MNIQLEYPTIISQTVPDLASQGVHNPLAPKGVPIANSMLVDGTMFRGVAGANGKWLIEPAAGWVLERLDIGSYKVIHNLGWTNTSLSVSLLVQPGSARIVEHNPLSFTVLCTINQAPTDLDFALVLSRLISSPTP